MAPKVNTPAMARAFFNRNCGVLKSTMGTTKIAISKVMLVAEWAMKAVMKPCKRPNPNPKHLGLSLLSHAPRTGLPKGDIS